MNFPDEFRWQRPGDMYHTDNGDPYGRFVIPGRHANGRELQVIAAYGLETGWEHVSVSLVGHPNKTPSWPEMCIVKRLFWEPVECVVQFHPAEENYVNLHEGVLHLWRCVGQPFPMPPKICV